MARLIGPEEYAKTVCKKRSAYCDTGFLEMVVECMERIDPKSSEGKLAKRYLRAAKIYPHNPSSNPISYLFYRANFLERDARRVQKLF